MTEHLKFAGKVLVALLIINVIAGFLGVGGLIQNPLGAIGLNKPAAS